MTPQAKDYIVECVSKYMDVDADEALEYHARVESYCEAHKHFDSDCPWDFIEGTVLEFEQAREDAFQRADECNDVELNWMDAKNGTTQNF